MDAGDHKGRPYKTGGDHTPPPRAAVPTRKMGRTVSAPYKGQKVP